MATVEGLVADALREIAVLAAGETPSASEGTNGLASLNRMINAWKAEQVFIFQNTRTTWAIVSGTGTYTVGLGGNVSVLRPVHIDAINIQDSVTTPPYEMGLRLMTDLDYAEVRIKQQTAYRPQAAYYNLTYPLATIILWPTPTAATLTGVLYAPEAVAEYTAITDTVALPPGYERMIVKNLAMELAPQYGANVTPQLERQAQDSFAVVVRANKRLEELRFDPGAMMRRRYYDIYSDLS